MTALKDVDTQKNGIVTVVLNCGPNRIYFEKLSFLTRAKYISDGIPHRVAALHYVYDDPMLYPLVAFSRFLLGARVRGRFLPHLVRKYT